jgi:hypothetical protein
MLPDESSRLDEVDIRSILLRFRATGEQFGDKNEGLTSSEPRTLDGERRSDPKADSSCDGRAEIISMELIPLALSSESDDQASLEEDDSSDQMARGTNSSSESSVSVPRMLWKNAARLRTLSDAGSSAFPIKASNPENSDTRKGRRTVAVGLDESSSPLEGNAGAPGEEAALLLDVIRDAMYSS